MRSNRPAFFKFFFPDTSADQLEIPSAFTASIQSTLPNKVVLRDRCNNIWRVKLVKVGDNLHLADGWPKFVEENCIKGGDMLVFEYFSNGLFDTKILGPSACEKKGVTAVQKTSVEEEEESSDDNYVSDSETDDEDSEEEFPANDSARKKRKQACTREKPGRTRRVLSDIYGVEIFRSGLARQPENPYFVAKVNPKRKSEFVRIITLVILSILFLSQNYSHLQNGADFEAMPDIALNCSR
ncbi:hypothetical protein DH2020_010784 [Rehmannia glutinosa]|uniref:TF-B3 domain-containing protein n=1 Tax=Rehmannia glutinosa TaxID=99300 RepID=A0ABR0XBN7_REHGL